MPINSQPVILVDKYVQQCTTFCQSYSNASKHDCLKHLMMQQSRLRRKQTWDSLAGQNHLFHAYAVRHDQIRVTKVD